MNIINSNYLPNVSGKYYFDKNSGKAKYTGVPSFGAGTDVFVKEAAKVFDVNAAKQLVGIFGKNNGNPPKGLNLTFSQSNGSLLCYSKDMGDGRVFRAIKKFGEKGKKQFFYTVFKEFKNGILKDIFAVDMETGELIKLKGDGTLSIFKDDFLKYKDGSTDPKYLKACEKIREYAIAVFGQKGLQAETTTERVKSLKSEVPEFKKSWRIDKSHYDDLPEDLQKAVVEIDDNLINLSALIDIHRGKSPEIIGLKKKYEPLIYVDGKQKKTVFKYRNTESLAVLHIKSNQRFTRIVHTNSNGIETHFLIDSAQKVVSNLNAKRPTVLPEKFRYMTKREIEESGIAKYIEFLNKQVKQYYDYMYEGLGGMDVKRRKRLPKSTPQDKFKDFMDDAALKISENLDEIRGDIEKRANSDAQEIVRQYFEELYKSFDYYAKESFAEFKKKFGTYLDKFTGNKN